MAATQQRYGSDDAAGAPMGTAYGELVARPVRRQEFIDRNQISRLNGLELAEAPNHQSGPVDQEKCPGPQVNEPHHECPECNHDQKRGHPPADLAVDQHSDADGGCNTGERCRGPPVIRLLKRMRHLRNPPPP